MSYCLLSCILIIRDGHCHRAWGCILKKFEKEEAEPFAAVVDYWLNGNIEDVPRSWETIVDVLQDSNINETAMAKTIEDKYCNRGQYS